MNSWRDIMEVEKNVYEKFSAVSKGIPFSSLSERWPDDSLTAGVTDTPAPRPDELLFLFALLILLSTVAIQIRAYGPLGSQGDGLPHKYMCVWGFACLCVVRQTLQVILRKKWSVGEFFEFFIRPKCPDEDPKPEENIFNFGVVSCCLII